MTLAVVAAAHGAGALVANRIRAEALLEEAGAVVGARVHDTQTDTRFEIRARATVNAAGPWGPELAGAASPAVKRVKGIHIVLPAIPDCPQAFLLTAKDGRVIFVIPWYGRTLVGTTEHQVEEPVAHATDDEVRYLLHGVHNGLPGLGWTEQDVIARFAGVRTLQAVDTQSLSAVTREFDVVEPKRGLLMPLGGKFTTARVDGAEIADRVQAALGVARTPSLTARRPLPGTPDTGETFERWQAAVLPLLKQRGVDEECARALTLRHGTRVGRIAELIAEDPGTCRRVHLATTLVEAEVVMAARDEMALSLEDVVRRRLPLALLVRMDRQLINDLARILAREWRRDSYEIVAESGGRAQTFAHS